MRKLRLSVDELRIDSFETTDEGRDGAGTILGRWAHGEPVPFERATAPETCKTCYGQWSCPGGSSCTYEVAVCP